MLAEKKELSAEEAAEVSQLWRKLVKLFHPDRFAHQPNFSGVGRLPLGGHRPPLQLCGD